MLGAIFETTRMTRNLLILHEADVCDYHALHSSMRVNPSRGLAQRREPHSPRHACLLQFPSSCKLRSPGNRASLAACPGYGWLKGDEEAGGDG